MIQEAIGSPTEVSINGDVAMVGLRRLGSAIIGQMYEDVAAPELHGRKGAILERERDRENAIDFFFNGRLEDIIEHYGLDLRVTVIKDKVRALVSKGEQNEV